jgi:hypothetical protein
VAPRQLADLDPEFVSFETFFLELQAIPPKVKVERLLSQEAH